MTRKPKTTKKKTVIRKPRVATREQRLALMFETSSDAYLNAINTVTQLLDQNTKLREEILRLKAHISLLSGLDPNFDDEILKDSDWDSMVNSVTDSVVKVPEDLAYGRDARPVNQQRTTNDLYRIAKKRHADHHAQYQERLEQYAEQEEAISKAVAEAKVNERPLDVQLSAEKERYYVETAKTIMGNKR